MSGDVVLDRDLLRSVIESGLSMGCRFVDVRFQTHRYQEITVENGILKGVSSRSSIGVGVRVVYGDAWGFASTNHLTRDGLLEALKTAISIAKATSGKSRKPALKDYEPRRDRVKSPCKVDPFEVGEAEKIGLLLESNKAALEVEGVKNAITRAGFEKDLRLYMNSEGADVEVETVLVGIGHISVAKVGESMERIWDSDSYVAGYEFIKSRDWSEFTVGLSKLAVEAASSPTPPAGTYPVIVDPEVVGLLLHEAFGHASEGDLVEAGNSVLKNRVGEKVASDLVTIVDDGMVEGGYFYPYDDEGIAKTKTVIVKRGVLKGYLNSRETAARLDGKPTGNSRAQDYQNIPIVRQTNYYMEPRDMDFEELIEDIEYGFYIRGVGSMGGEVNPGLGTFTFSVGPSKVIRNGELKETVRGVTISGMILETLKEIDGVGRDFKVKTSVFGACGKSGQRVRVGDGGPHVRIRKMVVGGRS